MARIGVYGGSFNPPHNGHIFAAQQLLRLLSLDRLLIVPAHLPPHKQLPDGTPDDDGRLRLCREAFAQVPGVEICTLEMQREGISFTVDTLRELKVQYPEAELVLILGTDMLLSFRSWYCPGEITKLATLAVLNRGDGDKIDAQVQSELETIRSSLGAKTVTVPNAAVCVSSTQVRRLLALGCPEGDISPQVAASIRENRWYCWNADWKNLPFEKLETVSLSLLHPKRVAHVRGCSRTAKALAERWGADPNAAMRAGILHDVTKALDATGQLQFCKSYGILLSDFERENPKLLHARTGAAAAERIFGESPEVCRAILWHTTGHANMDLLEKIIYLADYMEPTRCFDGVETLRSLAFEDLDAALLLGFEMSLNLLHTDGKPIDPNSEMAYVFLRNERGIAT